MIMPGGGEEDGACRRVRRPTKTRRSHTAAADGATVAKDAKTPTEAQQSHHSRAERQRMPTAARAAHRAGATLEAWGIPI